MVMLTTLRLFSILCMTDGNPHTGTSKREPYLNCVLSRNYKCLKLQIDLYIVVVLQFCISSLP